MEISIGADHAGTRIIGPMLAENAAEAFPRAMFSWESRDVRRVNKVEGMEESEFR